MEIYLVEGSFDGTSYIAIEAFYNLESAQEYAGSKPRSFKIYKVTPIQLN